MELYIRKLRKKEVNEREHGEEKRKLLTRQVKIRQVGLP
jgi:hypothetical protein